MTKATVHVDRDGVLPVALAAFDVQAQQGDIAAAPAYNAGKIDRWLNGGWDAHIHTLPFNNFAIEPNQGYFLKCSQTSTFTPS